MDTEDEVSMFKIEIEGLDKLQRDLEEATKALQSVDGSIGQISFDPADPRGVEDAVRKMEEMIDERTGPLQPRSLAYQLVAEAKAALANQIRNAASGPAQEPEP